MSFESVNVMNKQELGCNSSKTVEHGHDALDSLMSCSSDREEGEMEDGEIDDDEEGKVDEYNDSTSTNEKSPTKPKPSRDDVESEEEGRMHNSKRHKDRKRRHRKEKRHHHVSHKRRRGSQDEIEGPTRREREHSPSNKKSRRGPSDSRRPWDFDRPQATDEDGGVFGMSSNHSNGTTSNHKGNSLRLPNHSVSSRHGNENADDGKRSYRRQRSNSGISSRENENEKESMESNPSNDRDSEGDQRMQDLFSDGDDLDLDVAAHERDGAFQRPSAKDPHRQERQGPRNKKKKKTLKAKEYWHNRQRREEFTRRRDPERKRCRFYMEGRCGKMDDEAVADHCPYSHDFSPPKKLELCKFYAISSCLKGEYCVYMHDDFPCKFYHTGQRVCKYEKNCKFSHDQLTRDTKKVLERFIEERESNPDGTDENYNKIDPFALGEEDVREETLEIPDDRKNSLLGSPPLSSLDRGRGRGMGHESSPSSRNSVCDPLRGSSPGLQRSQGPTPPPFSGPRQSPQQSQNVGPQPVPPQQQGGPGPANMTQHHRPFGMNSGMNSSPESMMVGQMGLRPPHLAGQMPMRPMVGMGGQSTGPGPMMMGNRAPQPFASNPRMAPLMGQGMGQTMGPRPPANMLRPTGGPMHPGGGMMGGPMGQQFGGMGMPPGPASGYVDPQLDDLASMLVNRVKQQQDKTIGETGPHDEPESTSMLKAAGADDSDLDEETDSLDAMVHRMRKESEEQQRRQRQQPTPNPMPTTSEGLPPVRPPFQQFPPAQPQPQPLMQQQAHFRMGYSPQQMFGQGPAPGGMFMGRMPRPVGPPPMQFSAPANDENGAKQLYLRIAKQTATGRQEQMARETERQQKSPAAETPASPPPAEPEPEAQLGPREWKLIPLDVPLKTPYPLMRLPHDLHYSRSDPRLTGQLRLVGSNASTPPHAGKAQPGPDSSPAAATSPAATTGTVPGPASQSELGGRAYTPSMSAAALGPTAPGKDPRLGRQLTASGNGAPEMPAALLKKPTNDTLGSLKLEIDVEPQPRPPPKMQLSERASSFQPGLGDDARAKAGASAPMLTSPQAETRAYLMDPRFRRRKASTPGGATGSTPEHEPQTDSAPSITDRSAVEFGASKKDTTPVPSSGESSPID